MNTVADQSPSEASDSLPDSRHATVSDYVNLMSDLASIPEVLPALLREIADGGLPDGSSVGVRHEDDGTRIDIYIPRAVEESD